MSNDSSVDLLGSHITTWASILPDKSITFPAVIRPLPPGVYTIQVRSGKTAKVTVKDDEQVARKWTQEMLAKIRKADRLAQHIAAKYPTRALTEALLQQLSSDDAQGAGRAFEILWRLQSLPDNSLPYIKNAINKQLTSAKQGRLKPGAFSGLAYLASQIGTDEALALVLEVVKIDKDPRNAIGALANFKQEPAVKELRRFLSDPDEKIQFRAAEVLADRQDPVAMEFLSALVRDPKSRWREPAIDTLLKFPDDPHVLPALQSASESSDTRIRSSALIALRQLARQKKKEP
jgi:HEAT repeat protein